MKRIFFRRLWLLATVLTGAVAAVASDSRFYDYSRLSCSLVKTLCQDRHGYVWTGTEYGLNRFDGHRFTQYYHSDTDPASLQSNDIRSLCTDRRGRLWVGTSRGLQLYDDAADRFRTIPFAGISGTAVSRMFVRADGRLLAVTTGHGVFVLDERTLTLRRYPLLKDRSAAIVSIFEDSRRRLWIATGDKRLYCKSGRALRLMGRDAFGGRRVKLMGATEDGNVCFATDTGVYTWDEAARRIAGVPLAPGAPLPDDIRDMAKGPDGSLLVLSYVRGVYRVRRDARSLGPDSRYAVTPDNGAADFAAMLVDRDRNLWLGQLRHGLLMKPARRPLLGFMQYVSAGRPHGIGTVSAVASAADGRTWIGTMSGHVYTVDYQGRITADAVTGSPVYALAPHAGGVLAGTVSKGLVAVGRDGRSAVPFGGIGDQRVGSIATDRRGSLYVAVFGKGISVVGTGAAAAGLPQACRQMKDRHVNTLFTDSRDRLWAGHFKGVDVFDTRTGRLVSDPRLSALDAYACYALGEDRRGNIWIGTANGLYRWNAAARRLRHYTTADGLSNNTICGIAVDRDDNVWCSTFKGVCMVRAADGRAFSYYESSPFAEKEFSRGAFAVSPVDGCIFFGGLGGLTWFCPSDMRRQPRLRPVMITGMTAGGREVSALAADGSRPMVDGALCDAREIRLPSTDNTFTLDFSTMDFATAESSTYEFRIVENGEQWTQLRPGVSSVTFSHLSPGRYTLEVRAVQGGQYTPVRTVGIIVSPPWYLSWPAFAVYIVIVAVVIYLIYNNVRHRRFIDENERRTRLFFNIAHDLRSPLTLIASPLESLLGRDYDSETTRLLRTMYRNTQRIMQMMNEMLDIRRLDKGQLQLHPEATNLTAFARGIVETFSDVALRHRIDFSLDAAGDPVADIDRNQMDKVVVNLLDNAFKFTPDGGRIVLRTGTVSVRGTTMARIEVEDNGSGINDAEARHLFERFYQGRNNDGRHPGAGIGLNLCKMIVEMHHGTISARRAAAAGGSIFTIVLPLSTATVESAPADLPAGAVHDFLLSEPTEEERAHRRATAPARRSRVLIVDDDDDIRDFLLTELSDTFRVSVCRNGQEALQMAVSQLPDIVVTDVVMPEMDGNTLLRRLKTNTATSHIPVIMLTSKSERSDRLAGLELGADAYLAKPFVLSELTALIINLVNGRQLLKGKYSGAQEQAGRVESVEVKGNDEWLMERIMKAVNAHMADSEFTVEALASEVGLSRVQLHRRMKEMTGMATSDFIRNLRIRQAARLLGEHKVNVAQVAYAVGFVNRTHFSTVFRKYYGVSPQEYVEKHEKQVENSENEDGNAPV